MATEAGRITMRVNGKQYTFEIGRDLEPSTTLSAFLRQETNWPFSSSCTWRAIPRSFCCGSARGSASAGVFSGIEQPAQITRTARAHGRGLSGEIH